MFPILLLVYARLAKAEERAVLAERFLAAHHVKLIYRPIFLVAHPLT